MSVLICYNDSPSAKYTITTAAATLAQAVLPRYDVTLLHVWDPPPTARAQMFGSVWNAEAETDEELFDRAEPRAREVVEDGRRLAMRHGLMPHTLIACNESSIPDTILRIARDRRASLIVIGEGSRSQAAPTLRGTSLAVVAGAHCPVLVIPIPGVDGPSETASAWRAPRIPTVYAP